MFAHLQVHMQMENHYSSAHKGATYKEVHIYGIFQQRSEKAFDAYKKENGSDKKLPRISELNAEYAMLLERKRSSYAECSKTKSEMCKIMYIASVILCLEDI